ncbi:hypothetical protein P7K49_020178 [Saguinus oedipus]|uniref:Uncharacterized protein n=1 Tax=Saguinus oedipus TaxID=9490 RepID=A0ABQ9UZT8_SAGOE|nr:hypothetical protein P7K49_020178 [Saguinus oedipus]
MLREDETVWSGRKSKTQTSGSLPFQARRQWLLPPGLCLGEHGGGWGPVPSRKHFAL